MQLLQDEHYMLALILRETVIGTMRNSTISRVTNSITNQHLELRLESR